MIDYLYMAELTRNLESVDEMAYELRRRGFERAALHSALIARTLRRAEDLRDAIEPVWRIIDKFYDGKADERGVREVVEAWEAASAIDEREDARLAVLAEEFKQSAERLAEALDAESLLRDLRLSRLAPKET